MSIIPRVVAVLTSAALATGGITAMTASTAGGAAALPAKAAAKKYNFVASAYGSRVFNASGDLVDSGRTAWSFIACTSQTGKTKRDHLAQVKLPGDMLNVGPIRTKTRSVKTKKGVKAVSQTKVGDVSLKAAGVGSLHIEGLTGRSVAKNVNGKYRQNGSVNLLGIKAKLAGDLISLPLDPDNIRPGQEVRIPGLAQLRLLNSKGKTTKGMAKNNSVALELKVLAAGPLKGQTIRIGSARTKLTEVSPKGKVNGYGEAARGKLLNGLVSTGRIAHQPLKCTGTNGNWRRNNVAGVNAGVVRVGAATGQVKGITEPGRRPLARTKARVAGVKLTNQLRIGAIESSARVVKRNGKYKKSSNVEVLKVRASGQNWTKRLNRAIKNGNSLRIPGIAKITPNVVNRTKRSISVTGLKITLLDVAEPLKSTIRLANSKAKVTR